ncbi:MAG TPA: hypothetical protein VLS93_00620 [Anaeromyxobacteraceae bacterium]|nr:hypothetical protein [Anaeromyxobacteraceae bacterium]
MRRPPRHALALLALLGASGCAHAPAPAARPEVVWPLPPAAPRVRLVDVHPDPARPAPRPPAWRRVIDAVVGIDRAASAAALFARPFGLAVGPGGEILVADPDLPGVVRLLPGGRSERVACRDRAWRAPMAVALAAGGDLLVADAGAAEIVRVAGGACRRLGAGALERPTGVAVVGERLFAVDPPRHEVVELSPDGAAVRRFGGLGETGGSLHFPTAIAAAPDGTLLVVDALNFRVARFTPEGAFLGAFGSPGETDGAFARPKGVAVSPSGAVFVSDAQRDLVLAFRADGTFDHALGASGSGPGLFALPAGLAVAGGRLVVADSQNGRVQVFEILGGPR